MWGKLFRKELDKQYDVFLRQKLEELPNLIVAQNNQFQLRAEYTALGEYEFVHFFLVGPLNVKSFSGCELIFCSVSDSMSFTSDSKEIDSDYSKKSGIGITSFELDMSNELEHVVKEHNLTNVILRIRNEWGLDNEIYQIDMHVNNQEGFKELFLFEE